MDGRFFSNFVGGKNCRQLVLATIVILGHYFILYKDNGLPTNADLETHLIFIEIFEFCFLCEELSFKVQKSILKTETRILLSTFVLSLRSRFL